MPTRGVNALALIVIVATACGASASGSDSQQAGSTTSVEVAISTTSSTVILDDSEYEACLADANSVTPAIADCEAERIAQLEVRVNELNEELRSREQPSISPAVDAAQQHWIEYREAECRLAGLRSAAGTGEGLDYSSRKVRLTEARIAELAFLAEWFAH